MAFTMHSHSGEFCPGHAVDTLESIIQHTIKIGYKTIGLTEHMPRTALSDLYPEELLPSPAASLAALPPLHASFLTTASLLQAKYASQIHVLIGFEGEWIRDGEYSSLIEELAADERVDYFLGSLHHTKGIPIDYNKEMYAAAREECGGSERGLWAAYYDEQWEMVRKLRPRVVGHFDLVRLMSERPGRDVQKEGEGGDEGWKEVWEKMARNLREVRGYGGWLEVNTSALRKGLEEPYPARGVAEAWLEMGGRFTFSDDSHGIAQVATNYLRGLEYLESLGVKEVWTLERTPHPGVEGGKKAELKEKAVSIEEFRASLRLDTAGVKGV